MGSLAQFLNHSFPHQKDVSITSHRFVLISTDLEEIFFNISI